MRQRRRMCSGLESRACSPLRPSLVLAGAHTSDVVLSTVREAPDVDYGVIVLSDGQCLHDR